MDMSLSKLWELVRDKGVEKSQTWLSDWTELIFLPAILIPACASSSLAFLMRYCAYELNKQGDNIQPWCTLFPVWNQSVVPYLVLSVVSWPAYRFLRRQVRCSIIPSLEEFSTVCHDPRKCSSIVNGTEIDVFLEFSCFFYDPTYVGNLFSVSSAVSNSSSRFTYYWSLSWRILSITLLECEMSVIV